MVAVVLVEVLEADYDFLKSNPVFSNCLCVP
jgi:hypothetical protein